MANINETIEEVEKINPELARQIKQYVRNHSYGLVFENNLPEAVRLYKKDPAVGDTVNVLPPRGKMETDESVIAWVVREINGDKAVLERAEDTISVNLDDIVPVVSYRDVIYPGLKIIDKIENGNDSDPYHMVINAENYHALEALTYCYAGKVDCIYIDPPYNNKNRSWKYNNDYVCEDDVYKHSKWLAFMERRLKLARQLLNRNDSLLIVAIDENEYARLALLLEQLFPYPGAEIDMVTTVVNPRGKQRTGRFSRTEEYVFFVKIGGAKIHQEDDPDAYGVTSISWRTMRRSSLAQRRGNHGYGAVGSNQFYPVYVSDAGKIVDIGKPLPETQDITDFPSPEGTTAVFPIRDDGTEMNWGMKDTTAREMLKKGYIRVGRYTPKKPQKWELSYLLSGTIEDIEGGRATIVGKNPDGSVKAIYVEDKQKAPVSVWNRPNHNAEVEGTNLLKSIFADENRFPYPKSLYAVRDCLKYYVDDKPNALIIDFFAGSGTTLHAVNLINAADGGHRRCISVTNNEISAEEESEFYEKGLRPYDEEWENRGIANYVTWPRTVCTINGNDINGKPLKDEYLDVDLALCDGFKSNAVFCELTYENAWPIRLDKAFDAIAPILWMQAGCRGPIITKRGKSYLTTDYYGVLFDYAQASKFCEKVKATETIKTVFIVTDDQRRYSNLVKRLPGVDVHRLYETYLRTFEICGEGGLD